MALTDVLERLVKCTSSRETCDIFAFNQAPDTLTSLTLIVALSLLGSVMTVWRDSIVKLLKAELDLLAVTTILLILHILFQNPYALAASFLPLAVLLLRRTYMRTNRFRVSGERGIRLAHLALGVSLAIYLVGAGFTALFVGSSPKTLSGPVIAFVMPTTKPNSRAPQIGSDAINRYECTKDTKDKAIAEFYRKLLGAVSEVLDESGINVHPEGLEPAVVPQLYKQFDDKQIVALRTALKPYYPALAMRATHGVVGEITLNENDGPLYLTTRVRRYDPESKVFRSEMELAEVIGSACHLDAVVALASAQLILTLVDEQRKMKVGFVPEAKLWIVLAHRLIRATKSVTEDQNIFDTQAGREFAEKHPNWLKTAKKCASEDCIRGDINSRLVQALMHTKVDRARAPRGIERLSTAAKRYQLAGGT